MEASTHTCGVWGRQGHSNLVTGRAEGVREELHAQETEVMSGAGGAAGIRSEGPAPVRGPAGCNWARQPGPDRAPHVPPASGDVARPRTGTSTEGHQAVGACPQAIPVTICLSTHLCEARGWCSCSCTRFR